MMLSISGTHSNELSPPPRTASRRATASTATVATTTTRISPRATTRTARSRRWVSSALVGDLVGHLRQVPRDPGQPARGEPLGDPVLELDDHLLHRRGVEPFQPDRSAHGEQRSGDRR